MRDQSVDASKGVAIIAIVLGHVLRGLVAAGVVTDTATAHLWDTGLYLWHLAVFGFVAGLFISTSVMKRHSPAEFLRERIGNFIWLYLLWTAIQGSVKLAAGTSVNSRTSLADIVDVLHPEGQLWFFPWIAFATLLAVLVRPWETPGRAALTLGTSGTVAIASWGYGGGLVGTQGLALYFFIFAGATIGCSRYLQWLGSLSTILRYAISCVGVALTAAAIVIDATPPTTGFQARTVASVAFGVLGTFGGLSAVLALSPSLAHMRLFPYLGHHSLVIFVAHIVFASGTRILLMKTGITSLVVMIPVSLLLGVAGPIALNACVNRIHCRWLFQAPSWVTGDSRTRVANVA